MKFWFFLFPIFFVSIVFGLEEQPWFGNVYEFNFLGKYSYAYFNKVNGARTQLNETIHNHLLYLDLQFPFSSQWSVDADFRLATTTNNPFHFSSTAWQLRYLWLDDIVGDIFSLATSLNFRITTPKGLKELISYYHGDVDLEGNISIGKEFAPKPNLLVRFWIFGAVGIANKGSPWIRGDAALESIYDDNHKWAIFFESLSGYGRREHINPNDFKGYASIRHEALDLGLRYGYKFGYWGTLGIEYKRVLFARCSPRNINYFTLSYLLTFSF